MYVSNQGSSNVSVINGTKLVGTVAVGKQPQRPTYDPENGYVYVPNEGSDNVSVINGTRLVTSVKVGSGPLAATYDSSNGFVYVSNFGGSTVTLINGSAVYATVSVQSAPAYSVYDSKNGNVYVPDSGSSNVSVLNGTTTVGTVPGGIDPEYAVYDDGNGYVYVASTGWQLYQGYAELRIINGTTVVASPYLGSCVLGLALAYDSGKGFVYVVNKFANNVTVMNGTKIVSSLRVGHWPSSATYDPANGYTYVTNWNSSNVSVISGTTVIGSVSVGQGPMDAAVDEATGSVYVMNAESGTVSLVDPGHPYWLTLSESGLPSGKAWSATVNDSTIAGSGTTLRFGETNGTYDYRVGAVPGWAAARSTGSVTINGTDVSVEIAFTRVTYSLSFDEFGLRTGTQWSLNLSGTWLESNQSAITATEPNGTYAYALGPVGGYYARPMVGSVAIDGTSQAVSVDFLATYALTFISTGGFPGASWSVALNGTVQRSTGGPIAFAEPNGSYHYAVVPETGYTASPSSGSATVNGTSTDVVVTFAQVTYSVTFLETGLPQGTTWSVTLNGTTRNSTTTTVDFQEPNGTGYRFIVGPVTGFGPSIPSGVLWVVGMAVEETIWFYANPPPTFPLWFNETGLPGGTTWIVGVHTGLGSFGSTLYLAAAVPSIEFDSTPGSNYGFYVFPVGGYDPTPLSGFVSTPAGGAPVTQDIAFSHPAPSIAWFNATPSNFSIGIEVTFVTLVSEGQAPLTYSYLNLPSGCISRDAPTLSCVPSSTGRSTVTVAVSDALGRKVEANATVTVTPAKVSAPGSTLFGLPAIESETIVGLIIGVVAVAIAASAIFGRRGRTGSTPAGPPPRPGEAGPPQTP